jgi:predicted nucleic acid-binding protein
MIYLDSSLLLEIYLSQPRGDQARAVVALDEPKVSSWLLAIEVGVVLRRALGQDPRNHALLAAALTRLDEDLKAISLVERLAAVAARVRHEERFSQCRTLDALHAATALEIQAMAGHPVRLATFDQRLAGLASTLGLALAVG